MRNGLHITLILLACGSASAQVSPEEAQRRLEERRRQSASQPAAPVATRPVRSPAELQAEAVGLMKAGQVAKAAPLLEQAYKATSQPTRALVLNRAITDVTLRVTAMRAAKDVQAYLASNPQPDEQAVDILGAALQVGGKMNPRAKRLDLYKFAQKQLAASIAALEATRPGEHRLGNRWVPAAEFEAVRKQREAAELAAQAEEAKVADALRKLEEARAAAAKYNTVAMGAQHNHNNRLHGSTNTCRECSRARAEANRGDAARAAVAKAETEYKAQEASAERARSAIPEPQWATTFQPIE